MYLHDLMLADSDFLYLVYQIIVVRESVGYLLGHVGLDSSVMLQATLCTDSLDIHLYKTCNCCEVNSWGHHLPC